MRLLFIPSWFPSENNRFAGSFIERLAIDLSDAGIKIDVLHFDYTFKSLKKQKSKRIINDNLCIYRFTGFQLPKINNTSQKSWISKCLKRSREIFSTKKYDMVHSHDYVGSYVGNEISKIIDCPHVITIHHSDFIENKIPKWRTELLQKIFSNASTIIVPSLALKEALNEDYSIESIIIPHYIYWDVHPKERLKNPTKALSVTSSEKVKNNKGLIEFCIANNIELDLYGKVENSIVENENTLIKLKGEVPFTELQKKYNLYDYYISYSSIETFGLTVLEALSHGLPVLVKNNTGSKEMVNHNNGKIIESKNSFKEFIENYSMYNAMNISKEINKKFQKKIIIEKYKQLYDTI